MAQYIPPSLEHIAPFVSHYGYFGLFALLFLEDFGVPVPGETMLIAAAVFAGLGKLNIVAVVLVAIAAAFIGDNLGYLIGRWLGKEPLHRYGKYVFLTSEKIEKATSFFERFGGRIVIVARFIEGLRQLNGILAGVSGMHWRTFAVFNFIGASLWVCTWAAVGYFGGNHIDTIAHYGSLIALLAAAGVILYFVGKIVRNRLHARRKR